VRKEQLRPLLLLQEEAIKDWGDTDSPRVEQYDSVVVGLAPEHFHYQKLTEAFQLLKQGARLVAINKSRYFQTESGLALGAGAFVSALEYSADCKAEVVGKPSKQFFHLALSALEMEEGKAGQVLMVGDDIRDDVLGAQDAGLVGALVQTGKYMEGDEKKGPGLPDFVFPGLLQAVKAVVESLK